MKAVVLAIVFYIFLFSVDGFSIEFRRSVQDIRSLGMGNTGIASANTSGTIFYNLANITEGWIDIPSVQTIYSDKAKSFYQDIVEEKFLDSTRKLRSLINKYIGEDIYVQADVGVSFFYNVDSKGFTVGGNWIYERIYDYEINNPTAPEIDAFERYDTIKQIGLSYPIDRGEIVLGLAAKTVRRSEKTFVFTSDQLIAEEEFPVPEFPGVDDGETASGTGYAVGLLWRIPSPYRFVFGGVWRSEIDFDGEVTKIPEEGAVGLTMAHAFGIFRWTFALDLRDISYKQGSENDKNNNRRIHAGTELSIFPTSDLNYILSFRAGFNQGYQTTGAELRLGNSLVLGYARYTEPKNCAVYFYRFLTLFDILASTS